MAGGTRRDFLKRAVALSVSSAGGLSIFACRPGDSDTAVDRSTASDLARLDGMGMSKLARDGQITPLELVESAIRRTEQLNASLGAVVPGVFDVQSALARAEQPSGQGRLAGVPVMLKNLTDYEGASIDSGSRLYARAIERGTL